MLSGKLSIRRTIHFLGSAIVIASMVAIIGSYQGAPAADKKQKEFKSPEEAVKRLMDALKVNDTKELSAIFGPEGKELISSGDEVADKAGRERFIKAYEEMNKLAEESDKKVILHVGNEDFPFPVPIVKDKEK